MVDRKIQRQTKMTEGKWKREQNTNRQHKKKIGKRKRKEGR